MRKLHLITLALVAAAVAAPIAQGSSPTSKIRLDPLAASYLRQHGYSKSQIIALAKGSSPASTRKAVDPLAVSWLRGHGYSPSEIAAMTGVASVTGASRPVDPLAVSRLRGLGLSPSEITDWTVGICSQAVKPASCFAVFDRTVPAVPTTTSDGFAWGDAGIGAAATLGIVLLGIGLGFTLLGRGSRRQAPAPKHA